MAKNALVNDDMKLKFEPECDIRVNFHTNEYPNIFVSTNLYERLPEYIHTIFFDTNECPNIFIKEK